jgi:peptidoglycan/LPS O-acetylase OafA/YrhL
LRKEIKPLTGLRGVAALNVMLYHFFQHDAYLHSFVPSFVARGYLGVDIFFVLSGFVLAMNYAHHFKDGLTFASCHNFFVKRLARIYPLYIVITVLFSLKYMYNFSGHSLEDYRLVDFAACVAMIQSWGFGFTNVSGATWSLSTEFFAYLVFPAVILLVGFTRPIYAAVLAGVCVVFLYLVMASGIGVNGPIDVVSNSSVMPVLRCLAGFGLGIVAYRMTQPDLQIGTWLSSPLVAGALILALLTLIHFEAPDIVVFALFPFIVLALYYDSWVARSLFANRVVFHLGVVSYSIYLVHPLFVSLDEHLEPKVEAYLSSPAHVLTLVLVALATWAVACFLYWAIEVPGRHYLQAAFLRRTTRPAPVAAE